MKDGDLPKVSAALSEFGFEAKKLIEKFGGMPIYAGGDDLLFIAPVVGEDGRTTIFDLLENLEDNAFDPVKALVPNASLSFGVSITYFKFPMYESLGMARALLFDQAKKVDGKRAVAWTLQKHSGERFSAEFFLCQGA